MNFLGIDVGTGGTRALVIDPAGRIVGSATTEHVPFATPRPGWAEQDPADWWRATGDAVRGALADAGIDGARHRGRGLLRTDARFDTARRAGSGRPARAALVRPAHRRRVRRDHREGRRRPPDRADAQPGAHRLHPAQAAVGAAPRTRALGARPLGAPAQGLRPLPPDRRARHRRRRRLGHAALRRRQPPLVGRDRRRPRHRSVAAAARLRVAGGDRHGERRGRGRHRPAGRDAGRRRRRRSGGRRGRHGHRRGRARQRDDRHVGRRLRRDVQAGARSEGPRPHLLPRRAGHVARHGRHAGRRACRCAGCAT